MVNTTRIGLAFKNDYLRPLSSQDVPVSSYQGWMEAVRELPGVRTILAVGDQDAHLTELRSLLDIEEWRVLTARTGEKALETLHRSPVDLVILNSDLPDISGAEFCRKIWDNPRLELTPVLILSDLHTTEHEIACIQAGADAYMTRPYHPEALCARVSLLLRRKAVVNRLEESEGILLGLAQAVEQRDNITAGHCDRLAALCVAMGMAMQLPAKSLLALHRGGYLHDIGKIGMPDSILFKKGPLNQEEWRIMRTHTIKGEGICQPMKCLAPVLPIIRSHHERWDGSGYPDGLAGQDIPLLARVLQFADIYDALTSARSYKAAMISSDALSIMQEETNRGWHDPELMRLFLRLRHENLRDAAERNAEEWQDVQIMKQSLENLSSSILR